MYQNILTDSKFFLLLFKYDQDRALELHGTQCKNCGGKLDWGNYLRKPRGCSDLDEKCNIRFSLCCREEGCRKRFRPPSIRFLGSRVYFSAIFSLVIAMSQGARPKKIAQIKNHFDISHQTFSRWKRWWKEVFPTTKFWEEKKSILAVHEGEFEFPQTLLNIFTPFHQGQNALFKYLKFISPIDQVNDV